jgi:CRISPR-associated Csx2 family protein
MTTLISLIGKGRKKEGGYQTARYRFDQDFAREAPFFGLALTEFIKPTRLVLAGTAGSMWDVFLLEQQTGTDDAVLLELIDAVDNEAVTQELLSAHEAQLSEAIGIPVTCLLIPYARNEAEQIAILQALAGVVGERDQVALDVTHGFRHLPMLSLVAARYLSRVRKAEVQEVYYGAFDMTQNDETPVLRLSSLLHMMDWVESLATYEKDGDYGVFAQLLEADGMGPNHAGLLKQAAFFERTGNPVVARQKLTAGLPAIEAHDGPLGRLFRDELVKRVSWFRKPNRAEWERELADAYLDRGDYLRGTTYLYESIITRSTMLRGWDINDFNQRKEAFKLDSSEESKSLEYLRNAMSHGIRPNNDRDARLLSDEDLLNSSLQGLRSTLYTNTP